MHTLLIAALLLSGGAVPGATFGGTGVQGASVNYVALPSWGGSTIQVIKRDTGEVDRWRSFQRSTASRSRPTTARRPLACRADERTLVLVRGLERLPAATERHGRAQPVRPAAAHDG